jgi:hypothetical protein
VLVLSQAGQTSYKFEPVLEAADRSITFNALGVKTSAGRARYHVTVGGEGDGEWKVLVPAALAGRFLARYYDAAGALLPGASSVFGHGSFEIVAGGYNLTDAVITAALEVVLLDNAEGSRQVIDVSQGKFTLAVSTASVKGLSAAGATSQAIAVTLSPAWPGATWRAGLSSNYERHKAYFGNTPGTTLLDNRSFTTANTFTVTYPFLWYNVAPVAVVVIDLLAPDGTLTGIYQTIKLEQNGPVTTAPVSQQNSSTATYALSGDSGTYWWQAMHDIGAKLPAWTDGTKYIPSFAPSLTGADLDPLALFAIANHVARSRDLFKSGAAWLAADKRRVAMPNDNYNDNGAEEALESFSISGYTLDDGSGRTQALSLNGDSRVRSHPLWRYIFGGEGPFGAVNVNNLSLHAGSNGYVWATAFPSTFVPIIMDGTRCTFGIDPVARVVFMGEHDTFAEHNDADWTSARVDNWRMLYNIISWIINVNRYGDEFNARFHY